MGDLRARHERLALDASAVGLLAALASAVSFATSGAVAKSLLDAGWSPASVVIVRLGGAALVLAVPAALSLRGRWHLLVDHWRTVLLYGVFAGAIVQVAYFNAIQFIDVGIALLIEYMGVLLVVLWGWLRRGRRPGPLTFVGMAVALTGLAVVIGPSDVGGIDPRGVAWASFAALGMATYFITSAETTEIPPVAFVSAGLGVGAVALWLIGLAGVMPLATSFGTVSVRGTTWPWWLPLVLLVLVAAVIAYTLGFVGARHLGATVAGFVGLTEVVFAFFWAWLLVGEVPTALQVVGGLVLLTGVATVQVGSRRDALPEG